MLHKKDYSRGINDIKWHSSLYNTFRPSPELSAGVRQHPNKQKKKKKKSYSITTYITPSGSSFLPIPSLLLVPVPGGFHLKRHRTTLFCQYRDAKLSSSWNPPTLLRYIGRLLLIWYCCVVRMHEWLPSPQFIADIHECMG